MIQSKTLKYYKLTQSFRKTSLECGISPQKVRKILIDAGEYHSPLSDKIADMAATGKTAVEIAKELMLSRNCVISYLPYSRGPLFSWNEDVERSINARRVHASRLRKIRNTQG